MTLPAPASFMAMWHRRPGSRSLQPPGIRHNGRTSARSSTDRATGFYPVGWGFESLRAHFCVGIGPFFRLTKCHCTSLCSSEQLKAVERVKDCGSQCTYS